jgi:hypothetical protein
MQGGGTILHEVPTIALEGFGGLGMKSMRPGGDGGLDGGAGPAEGKNALSEREIRDAAAGKGCDATSAEMAGASMPQLMRIRCRGVIAASKEEGGGR